MNTILLSFVMFIIGCYQDVATPRITESDQELAKILGSISGIYSESQYLHKIDAIFVTDYYSDGGIAETDSDYMHYLYLSVTRAGDPPDFKLYKVGPFYEPSFKGFKPKIGNGSFTAIYYGVEIEYSKGDEGVTMVISFNFEFARIE